VSHLKNLTLKVWRQSGPKDKLDVSRLHQVAEISDEASFLELLDVFNEAIDQREPRSSGV
jgi:hypothetical protein